ncbi:tripartite motif-containing 16-like isoform X1 [Labeo rohita]|uniref:Tripartite motif-containing 16-like isoform X1 n=1 Tax=Labeo rohita TaxID=84645 RepID=A0A498NA99_LABRO|nr:tripartite motif-containing 16-like isoform X1 [Labeo rohita]RXN28742.1 tripartite motif-containing 16-like isoform X1 [Labeo rohita]
MADSDYLDYTCPLCTDIQRDPVTIPCGDTFCLECIKIYWDHSDHLGVYSCPQCQTTFAPRPILRRNVPHGNALRAQTESDKIFIEMSQAVERWHAEISQLIQANLQASMAQNFPTLSVAPEPMVPKVLINPEFSFSEITKTVSDMKEHLDDICKKELGNISKRVSDTSVYILIPRSGGRMTGERIS